MSVFVGLRFEAGFGVSREQTRGRMVEPGLFARFDPLTFLRADERLVLASHADILRLATGQLLFSQGTFCPWAYFLLVGRMRLSNGNEQEAIVVEAGGTLARMALNAGSLSKNDAVTLSTVELLRFDVSLMPGLSPSPRTSRFSPVRLTGLADNACCVSNQLSWLEGVFDDVVGLILDQQLVLPTPPGVGARIADLVSDGDPGEEALIEAVWFDPAICVKVMRVANGALYQSQAPVGDCAAAVKRLGLVATRNLIMNYAILDGQRSVSGLLRNRFQEHWSSSTLVAAISVVLAARLSVFVSARCRLAGLLHNIGTLVLLVFAYQSPEVFMDEAALDEAILVLAPSLGATILSEWGLGDEMACAAQVGQDWYREHGTAADFGDLVLVAQVHSRMGQSNCTSMPELSDMPAFRRLGLDAMDPKDSIDVLVQAQEHMAAAQDLL